MMFMGKFLRYTVNSLKPYRLLQLLCTCPS